MLEEAPATLVLIGDGTTVRKKTAFTKKISLTWKRINLLGRIVLVIQLA